MSFQDEYGDQVFQSIPLGLLSDMQFRIDRVIRAVGDVKAVELIDGHRFGYRYYDNPRWFKAIPDLAVEELKQFKADIDRLLEICREHDPKKSC